MPRLAPAIIATRPSLMLEAPQGRGPDRGIREMVSPAVLEDEVRHRRGPEAMAAERQRHRWGG